MEEDIIFEGALASCLRGSKKTSQLDLFVHNHPMRLCPHASHYHTLLDNSKLEKGKDFAAEIAAALPDKTAIDITERHVFPNCRQKNDILNSNFY